MGSALVVFAIVLIYEFFRSRKTIKDDDENEILERCVSENVQRESGNGIWVWIIILFFLSIAVLYVTGKKVGTIQ